MDVEVQGIELSAVEGVPVHRVRGRGRRASVDAGIWQAGVVEESDFELQLPDEARKVVGHRREFSSPPHLCTN